MSRENLELLLEFDHFGESFVVKPQVQLDRDKRNVFVGNESAHGYAP
jgi:hypothetical protein